MEIVLLERVEKLGFIGDVVKVKDGYARNFLLPQGKALRATKANLVQFEKMKAEIEANNLKLKTEAEAVARKMGDSLAVSLVRAASEAGALYGSASARDIAEAVTALGYKLDRNQVILAAPIKTLGLTKVTLRLHPEVSAPLLVNIARTEEEAAIQLQKGRAVSKAELAAEKEAAEDAIDAANAA